MMHAYRAMSTARLAELSDKCYSIVVNFTEQSIQRTTLVRQPQIKIDLNSDTKHTIFGHKV